MASTSVPTSVFLRAPSSHTHVGAVNKAVNLSPPTSQWMTGVWHVTHSTLPMWKGRFGVKITYAPLPESSTAAPDFDDMVEYQKTSGGKWSSVHGISRSETIPKLGSGWAYSWRGKGWLMIASSAWEVLGFGEDLAASAPGGGDSQGRDWVVTYFSKTMFTPAGIDVYSKSPEGVSAECLENIKAEFAKFEDANLKKLGAELFEIPRS